MTDIDKMTPAQLDYQLASELGDDELMKDWYIGKFIPSSNFNHCHRAVSRVRELGLIEEYTNNLVKLISESLAWIVADGLQTVDIDSVDGWHIIYEIAHAPCDTRCRAILRTVREARV